MHEATEGKDNEPDFAAALEEIETNKAEENRKEERMGEYPPVAEDVPEEELSHWLIDDIREKRSYQQQSDVNWKAKEIEVEYSVVRSLVFRGDTGIWLLPPGFLFGSGECAV
jgi:hypothetical protein